MVNPTDRWATDDAGNPVMPDKQREYLEWLIDPERKGSQKAWANASGVPENRLRVWKNDPRFKAELDKRLAELNVDTFRIQRVVESMWKAAVEERDTKAASIYLQYVGRFIPTQRVISDATVANLTDQELDAELAALASERHFRAVEPFDHDDDEGTPPNVIMFPKRPEPIPDLVA